MSYGRELGNTHSIIQHFRYLAISCTFCRTIEENAQRKSAPRNAFVLVKIGFFGNCRIHGFSQRSKNKGSHGGLPLHGARESGNYCPKNTRSLRAFQGPLFVLRTSFPHSPRCALSQQVGGKIATVAISIFCPLFGTRNAAERREAQVGR